jgi:hypothetical protein
MGIVGYRTAQQAIAAGMGWTSLVARPTANKPEEGS